MVGSVLAYFIDLYTKSIPCSITWVLGFFKISAHSCSFRAVSSAIRNPPFMFFVLSFGAQIYNKLISHERQEKFLIAMYVFCYSDNGYGKM